MNYFMDIGEINNITYCLNKEIDCIILNQKHLFFSFKFYFDK